MFINEIFQSIDGEVNAWGQGVMTTFIRFQGCNLKCNYCDTMYAHERPQAGNYHMLNVDVLSKVLSFGNRKITITGGEPFLQKDNVLWLCNNLPGIKKSIETNGSMEILPYLKVRTDISLVIDYKLDHEDVMDMRNYQGLNKRHWIKFVISNLADVKRVLFLIKHYPYMKQANIALSPNHEYMQPQELVDFLKNYVGDVMFTVNLQLHKYIWPKNMRAV